MRFTGLGSILPILWCLWVVPRRYSLLAGGFSGEAWWTMVNLGWCSMIFTGFCSIFNGKYELLPGEWSQMLAKTVFFFPWNWLVTGPGWSGKRTAAGNGSLSRWKLGISIDMTSLERLQGDHQMAASFRLPSGKHTKSYWTWPFIVDLPIKKGDFP